MIDLQNVMGWQAAFRKHFNDFRRSIRNKKYERTPGGLILPEHKVGLGGIAGGAVRRLGDIVQPWVFSHNVNTDQGLNAMVNIMLHDTARIATWYIAPFTAGSPSETLTAALFPSTHTETSAYSESTRQEYNNAASTAKSTTNAANMAVFTGNADVTVTGIALLSVATKQSTSGVCFSAALFSSSRHLAVVGDELLGKYTFTIADL